LLEEAAAELTGQLTPYPGVVVEHKRYAVAVHYRNAAPEAGAAVTAAVHIVGNRLGLKATAGRFPHGAGMTAAAVNQALQQLAGERRIIHPRKMMTPIESQPVDQSPTAKAEIPITMNTATNPAVVTVYVVQLLLALILVAFLTQRALRLLPLMKKRWSIGSLKPARTLAASEMIRLDQE
jgi:hypothetical protein